MSAFIRTMLDGLVGFFQLWLRVFLPLTTIILAGVAAAVALLRPEDPQALMALVPAALFWFFAMTALPCGLLTLREPDPERRGLLRLLRDSDRILLPSLASLAAAGLVGGGVLRLLDWLVLAPLSRPDPGADPIPVTSAISLDAGFAALLTMAAAIWIGLIGTIWWRRAMRARLGLPVPIARNHRLGTLGSAIRTTRRHVAGMLLAAMLGVAVLQVCLGLAQGLAELLAVHAPAISALGGLAMILAFTLTFLPPFLLFRLVARIDADAIPEPAPDIRV